MASIKEEEMLDLCSKMDKFLNDFSTSNINRKANELGRDLIKFLTEHPEAMNYYQDVSQFTEGLSTHWVLNQNSKVSQIGLEALMLIAEAMQAKYKNHARDVLSAAITKLGDSKESLREKARAYLLKTVDIGAQSASQLLEKLTPLLVAKNKDMSTEAQRAILEILTLSKGKKLPSSTLNELVEAEIKCLSNHLREDGAVILIDLAERMGKTRVLDLLAKEVQNSSGHHQKKIQTLMVELQDMNIDHSGVPALEDDDETDLAISKPKKTTTGVKPKVRPTTSGMASKGTLSRVGSIRGTKIGEGDKYSLHSGPAGEADEAWFMSAFEDVPVILCVNQREFENITKKITDDLKSGAEFWERKVEALKRLRSLILHVTGYEEEIQIFVKNVGLLLMNNLKDLRSQVVRETCLTFAFICRELKNKVETHTCEIIMQQLMSNVMSSAKVIATASYITLKFMLTHVHHSRLINTLVQTLSSSKSREVRTAACELLHLVLQEWPVHRLEQQLATLQDGIRRGTAESSSEGRLAARKAFWAFRHHFPDQGDALLNNMDSICKKAIMGGSTDTNDSSQRSTSGISRHVSSRPNTVTIPRLPSSTAGGSVEDLSCDAEVSSRAGPRTPSTPRRSSSSAIPVLKRSCLADAKENVRLYFFSRVFQAIDEVFSEKKKKSPCKEGFEKDDRSNLYPNKKNKRKQFMELQEIEKILLDAAKKSSCKEEDKFSPTVVETSPQKKKCLTAEEEAPTQKEEKSAVEKKRLNPDKQSSSGIISEPRLPACATAEEDKYIARVEEGSPKKTIGFTIEEEEEEAPTRKVEKSTVENPDEISSSLLISEPRLPACPTAEELKEEDQLHLFPTKMKKKKLKRLEKINKIRKLEDWFVGQESFNGEEDKVEEVSPRKKKCLTTEGEALTRKEGKPTIQKKMLNPDKRSSSRYISEARLPPCATAEDAKENVRLYFFSRVFQAIDEVFSEKKKKSPCKEGFEKDDRSNLYPNKKNKRKQFMELQEIEKILLDAAKKSSCKEEDKFSPTVVETSPQKKKCLTAEEEAPTQKEEKSAVEKKRLNPDKRSSSGIISEPRLPACATAEEDKYIARVEEGSPKKTIGFIKEEEEEEAPTSKEEKSTVENPDEISSSLLISEPRLPACPTAEELKEEDQLHLFPTKMKQKKLKRLEKINKIRKLEDWFVGQESFNGEEDKVEEVSPRKKKCLTTEGEALTRKEGKPTVQKKMLNPDKRSSSRYISEARLPPCATAEEDKVEEVSPRKKKCLTTEGEALTRKEGKPTIQKKMLNPDKRSSSRYISEARVPPCATAEDAKENVRLYFFSRVFQAIDEVFSEKKKKSPCKEGFEKDDRSNLYPNKKNKRKQFMELQEIEKTLLDAAKKSSCKEGDKFSPTVVETSPQKKKCLTAEEEAPTQKEEKSAVEKKRLNPDKRSSSGIISEPRLPACATAEEGKYLAKVEEGSPKKNIGFIKEEEEEAPTSKEEKSTVENPDEISSSLLISEPRLPACPTAEEIQKLEQYNLYLRKVEEIDRILKEDEKKYTSKEEIKDEDQINLFSNKMKPTKLERLEKIDYMRKVEDWFVGQQSFYGEEDKYIAKVEEGSPKKKKRLTTTKEKAPTRKEKKSTGEKKMLNTDEQSSSGCISKARLPALATAKDPKDMSNYYSSLCLELEKILSECEKKSPCEKGSMLNERISYLNEEGSILKEEGSPTEDGSSTLKDEGCTTEEEILNIEKLPCDQGHRSEARNYSDSEGVPSSNYSQPDKSSGPLPESNFYYVISKKGSLGNLVTEEGLNPQVNTQLVAYHADNYDSVQPESSTARRYTPSPSLRSNSAIDLQAVQRAKARQQYAAIARQKVGSGTSLPRAKKVDTSNCSGPMSGNFGMERTSRTRSRAAGVSHSQPSSRSGSPSSRLGYHTYNMPETNSLAYQTRRNVPRSQGTSRETSPNRFGSKSSLTNLLGPKRRLGMMGERPPIQPSRPVMAQKMLAQSLEAENVPLSSSDLYDPDCMDSPGHKPSPRKTSYRSFEDPSDDSDASSLCSEKSFDSYRRTSDSYSWSGSQQRLYRDVWETSAKDITEIIANCESTHWSDRKEGLVALQAYLQASNTLTVTEIKRLTDIFTRMFMDSHTKVFSLFLDTLNELIVSHKTLLIDWLYILLTRLLNKLGADLLGSIQNKILKSLDVVRESFPAERQLASVLRFLTDPTQTPNLRVKTAALNFVTRLAAITDPGLAFPPPTPSQSRDLVQAALHKMIGWTMGDSIKQGMELRRAAQEAILALFNLNTPQVTLRLANLPQEYQEAASTLLRGRVRRGSSSSLSGTTAGSPPSPSPRLMPSRHMSRSHDTDLPDTPNPEDVYRSLRKTTAEIQNYTYETGTEKPPEKANTSSKDSGISQLSGTEALEEAMEELSLDSSCTTDQNTGLESLAYRVLTVRDCNGVASAENCQQDDGNVDEQEAMRKIVDALKSPPDSDNGENISIISESEKKACLGQLTRLIQESSVTILQENFKNLLRILLRNLAVDNGTKDVQVRVLVLTALTELIKKPEMRDSFNHYVELLILKVLNSYKDISKEVTKSAESCAYTIAMTLAPSMVIRVLAPLIQTGEYPLNLAALKMLTKLVDSCGKDPVREFLPDLMPGLIQAYDNQESSVRKSAVLCMVSLHLAIGEEELKPHLAALNGSKLKLLHVYIQRSQQSSSTPTSPRNHPPAPPSS